MLYFCLDGNHLTPQFYHKIPKSKSLIKMGIIKWKLSKSRTILVNLLADNYNKELLFEGQKFIDAYPHFKNKNFGIKHLPILRSQLQKCARRCKIEVGVKTAVSMALIEDKNANVKQIGLFELLRRLTIIIIEDTVLSNNYPFLMWCMVILTKGIYLNSFCIEKILEIVKGVMASPYCDPLSYNFSKSTNLVLLYDSIKNNNLLTAVLLRSSFRGMTCDYNMLLSCIKTWNDRLNNTSNLMQYLSANTVIPLNKINQLKKEEIQPESLDFHCTNIVDRIQEYIEIDGDILKNLIWDYSSSINIRFNIVTNKISRKKENSKWSTIKYIFLIETKKIALCL